MMHIEKIPPSERLQLLGLLNDNGPLALLVLALIEALIIIERGLDGEATLDRDECPYGLGRH